MVDCSVVSMVVQLAHKKAVEKAGCLVGLTVVCLVETLAGLSELWQKLVSALFVVEVKGMLSRKRITKFVQQRYVVLTITDQEIKIKIEMATRIAFDIFLSTKTHRICFK